MEYFIGFIAGVVITFICGVVWMMEAMAEGEIDELAKEYEE